MQGPLFKGLPIFFVVLFALFRSSNTFAIVPRNRRIKIKNNNDKIVLCALKKEKVEGVYARPSAAIERGSGFYIPGLEGFRVRILSGFVILGLSYVNSNLSSITEESSGALQLSNNLAAVYGFLLFFQALVDYGKETLFSSSSSEQGKKFKASGTKQLQQVISSSLKENQELYELLKWTAATYVSLTPSKSFLVVDGRKREIVYGLGNTEKLDVSSPIGESVASVCQALSKSKGGRVSVPVTHPASLLIGDEFETRCIVLQRIDNETAFVVGSDQLLAGYTKNDLKWLGNMANLVSNRLNES